jgi:hypothetical protein
MDTQTDFSLLKDASEANFMAKGESGGFEKRALE